MQASLPIGVFDSGMGGLTVLRELANLFPNESFIYLGDTARLPYGTKSEDTVREYALTMARLLVQHGIKMLVVACNTATAAALTHLQQHFPELPIVGVIRPGANAAHAATQNNKVLLLATETTIHSQAYHKILVSLNPELHIQAQPCGLFVALAEEGCVNDAVSAAVIQKYLAPHLDSQFDTIILGCTHFPVFADEIKQFIDRDITIINSAYETAKAVETLLKDLLLESPAQHERSIQFYVTDLPERFLRVSRVFLDFEISRSAVQVVNHKEHPIKIDS